MHAAVVIGLVAALAACQSAPGAGGSASAPQRAAPSARYVSEGVLEVTAVDPQPISDVEIVGPRGPLTSALSVHREDAADPNQGGGGPPHPMSTGGQLMSILPFIGIGFGSFSYGSGGFGVGHGGGLWLSPGMSTPYGPSYGAGSAALGQPAPSGLYRSTARVTIDDPAAYQRDWRQSHLRVRLGDPRTGPTQDLPAPAPNAAPTGAPTGASTGAPAR
jgi:hypothetical protein